MSSFPSAELTLPGIPSSVPLARRYVRETLVGWGLHAVVDRALLVVSELCANAVLHTRSEFTVRLGRAPDGSLRLEVLDRSALAPQPRAYTQGSTTGRGLAIVDELVSEWGVEPRADGKAVWVHLAAGYAT